MGVWKKLSELKMPFNDAVNYTSKVDKDFFNKLFLRTAEVQNLIQPNIYYLVGEKGSGKTAYAVWVQNNTPRRVDAGIDVKSKVVTMTETQYKRFIQLKDSGRLTFSDYANIWRPMLCSVAAQVIVEKSKNFFHKFLSGKFNNIEAELNEFHKGAMNPEIESAFEHVTGLSAGLKVGNEKVASGHLEGSVNHTESGATIRHHLLEKERGLKSALSELRLSDDHIVFIDAIDFKPDSIAYGEYVECVKGLAEASWQLNTEFFNGIKDSNGRIKIVLLLRPDIMSLLSIYNSNSRIQDNTVLLDWSTTEKEYKSSPLYELSGRYFASQQHKKDVPADLAWRQYIEPDASDDPQFRELLKLTFQKPRDILTFVRLALTHQSKNGHGEAERINADVLTSTALRRDFTEYLLGEVRNYSAFYMPSSDFNSYIKFFQYLNGSSKFRRADCDAAFGHFIAWAAGEPITNRDFLRDVEALLQFFYDVNVIGYSEQAVEGKGTFYHWAYRERTLNNISPKVKTEGVMMLNPGIAKSLDIGVAMRTRVNSVPAKVRVAPSGRGEQPARGESQGRRRGRRGGKSKPKPPRG